MAKPVTMIASVIVYTLVCGFSAHAQQRPVTASTSVAASPMTPAPLVPLEVRVVISRFQGEKQVSSLPYTLAVNANENKSAELNEVVQILIPMVTVDQKTTGPVYKDVGTEIKCVAATIDGGRFKLDMQVEDASVVPDAKLPSDGVHGPWLQTFRSVQTILLKDGQTTQYTTATDKGTGEVVKIDVTLEVVR